MRELDSVDFSDVVRRYHLILILLFGSRATGLTHARSDVDIAVLVQDEHQVDLVDLTCVFMSLLKTNDVDLVLLNTADYFLRYEITQNCRVLYEAKPDLFVDYALRAMQAYEANKPLEKLRGQILYEEILHKPAPDSEET